MGVSSLQPSEERIRQRLCEISSRGQGRISVGRRDFPIADILGVIERTGGKLPPVIWSVLSTKLKLEGLRGRRVPDAKSQRDARDALETLLGEGEGGEGTLRKIEFARPRFPLADDPVLGEYLEDMVHRRSRVIHIGQREVLISEILELVENSRLPQSIYELLGKKSSQKISQKSAKPALDELDAALARHRQAPAPLKEPDADKVLPPKVRDVKANLEFEASCAFLFLDEKVSADAKLKGELKAAVLRRNVNGIAGCLKRYLRLPEVRVAFEATLKLADATAAAQEGNFKGFCKIGESVSQTIELHWYGNIKNIPEWELFCIRAKFGRRLDSYSPGDWRHVYPILLEIASAAWRIRADAKGSGA